MQISLHLLWPDTSRVYFSFVEIKADSETSERLPTEKADIQISSDKGCKSYIVDLSAL